MPRRGNGEGTITRRPDGRWAARYPVRESGRPTQYKWLYGKTRKEVQEKLKLAQRALDAGLRALGPKDTLAAYLTTWLDEIIAPNRAPLTHIAYRAVTRAHLIPALGNTRLDRLTPPQVRALVGQLQAQGLAPATVKLSHAVLRAALQQAVRDELLDRNVARLVAPPAAPPGRIKALAADEIAALLRAAEGNRYEAVFVLALLTGLRRGEILGLPWRNLDLERQQLRVTQQAQWVAGRGHLLGPTKTRRDRELRLPARAVAPLERLRDYNKRQRELAGPRWETAWDEHDLVFRSATGTPVLGRAVLAEFRAVLDRSGLPARRLHDLRHDCASALFRRGVPAKTIQEILGHANIGVTLNIYTDVAQETTDAALQGLEEDFA